MNTFNGFCHGTNHKNVKEINIISQFYNDCTEKKYVLDGPDSFGTEMTKNTKRLVTEITKWYNENPENRTVNLTGFSRGAITCIAAANAIKELQRKEPPQLKDLKINIFAIDPVAGMNDKKRKQYRTIPDNVKNFTAIYQLDEMRRDFKPQDITRLKFENTEKTNIQLLPMYGNHSDTTKITAFKALDISSAPIIVWNLLYKFLTTNGAEFKNSTMPAIIKGKTGHRTLETIKELTDIELLEKFSEMHLARENFKNNGRQIKLFDGLPVTRVPRKINSQLMYYTGNHEFFINEYERELFKKHYPKTFKYYFAKDVNVKFSTELLDESPKMWRDNEKLAVRLAQFTRNPFYRKMQTFDVSPKITSDDHPTYKKLKLLEFNIYNLTLLYEREKSSINIFDKRSQAKRAQKIRAEIYNLIHGQNISVNEKYQKTLGILENHYKNLIKSSIDSELKQILENILEKHDIKFNITQSLPNTLIANLCKAMFNLIIETFKFIANLGYLGGAVFSNIGLYLYDLGNRLQDAIGNLGYNPFKYVAGLLALTITIAGFTIKNRFFIKVITDTISNCLNSFRDAIVSLINDTKFEKIDNKPQ